MGAPHDSPWEQRRLQLLDKARQMKLRPVVDRAAVLDLQAEIRELERRADRTLPPGMTALRVFPALKDESVGRVPVPIEQGRIARSCPFDRCDGSGWVLHVEEDVASPCSCQRLPRDREARRQTKRILRRQLAPGLASPPLSLLPAPSRERLSAFVGNLDAAIDGGLGLWMIGAEEITSPACAFVATEALRSEVATLLYPGDELIGRLRRLAGRGKGAVEREIYDRLAAVDLLVIDGLDDAARISRFPEVRLAEDADDAEDGEATGATEYRPAMTAGDLARIFAVIDERLRNLKATVVTTRDDALWLEEQFLRLPGKWPTRVDGATAWDEPRRRHGEVKRLLSRFRELVGLPVPLDCPRDVDVRSEWEPPVSVRRSTRSRVA